MADIFARHLLQHIPFIESEFKAIAFQAGFEFDVQAFQVGPASNIGRSNRPLECYGQCCIAAHWHGHWL